MPNTPHPHGPFSFNEVLLDELRHLRPGEEAFRTRVAAGYEDPANPRKNKDERSADLATLFDEVSRLGEKGGDRLSALCLSGGGIRSATFNLGVLQGLARAGVLGRFDYLSSVSGGGYIAGWLKAWMRREGTGPVIEALRPRDAGEPADATARPRNPLAPEPNALDRLREYSNYLTPRLGLTSLDTWAAAAIVVRNLLLNWSIILPALMAVVMLMQAVLVLVQSDLPGEATRPWLLGAAIASAMAGSLAVHRFRHPDRGPGTSHRRIVFGGVVPLVASVVLMAVGLARTDPETVPAVHLFAFCLLWGVFIPLAGWAAHEPFWRIRHEGSWPWREMVALVASGMVGAVVLLLLAYHAAPALIARPILYVVLGPPLLLADYLLSRTLFVAFAGIGIRDSDTTTSGSRDDADREWWARFSGLILLVAVGWVALGTLVLLGWHLVFRLGGDVLPPVLGAMGGVAGILVSVLGKSSETGTEGKPRSPVKEWVMRLAAPLFVLALVVGVAELNLWVAQKVTGTPDLFVTLPDLGRGAFTPSRGDVLFFFLFPLVLVAIASLMGWAVNVNRFSLHGFYRNRLVRAFIGASNPDRRPDPFTGFDIHDNLKLHALWSDPGDGAPDCRRPLLVVNTALNLVTSGEKLAWQQRKAESFSMTPFYCGNFFEGYRRSAEYGGSEGISLGTALTISGAAANPNAGCHSSPVMTFLMTVFNARLGAWLGNTNANGDDTYRHASPRWAVRPLFSELVGLTNARSKYVNLSDGGHFDNLGLYEMVLRRCRFILVSDAGHDPDAGFGDLGNAIRKIRIDFGIQVEFTQKIQIPPRAEMPTGMYCAIGRIRYGEVDGAGAVDGTLIYLKPALYGRGEPIPYDVFSYAHTSADFPHEPTDDQWFSESQFESYRALGLHAATQVIRSMPRTGGETPPTLDDLEAAVRSYIRPRARGKIQAPPIFVDDGAYPAVAGDRPSSLA